VTYDVHIGGAIQIKELPFVVGVLADLSGKPATPLKAVKDREFVDIDPDNFNKVLAGMKPRLAFEVDNRLPDPKTATGKLPVELKFESMDDFSPERIADQVEPLRKLVEARARLANLMSKLDGNDQLDTLLQEVVGNTEAQKRIRDEARPTETPAQGGSK